MRGRHTGESGAAVLPVIVLLAAAMLVAAGSRMIKESTVETYRCQSGAVASIGGSGGPMAPCGATGAARAGPLPGGPAAMDQGPPPAAGEEESSWIPAILRTLSEIGSDMLRVGVVIGGEGSVVARHLEGVIGYDMVFDLYHQELTLSRYTGGGLATHSLGAEVHGYVGLAFGFEESVDEWNGHFAELTGEVRLPFDVAAVNGALFTGGSDENDNHFVGPNEIWLPPRGVYGFTVGASVGGALGAPPLGLAVTQARWRPRKEAIAALYDRLRQDVEVRLVDASKRECPAGWPGRGGERNCVISFGDPDASWLSRSLESARAMCAVTVTCTSPLARPLGALALGAGAARAVLGD